MSSGSLISRIGARARANENQWAKKEQEIDLQQAKKNKKKVIVFAEDVAASGGYLIACAGDEIYYPDY